MNKLIFSMDFLNIVQGYGSGWTHSKHSDYPIDVMGKDTNARDWFCCPCESVRISRIYGVVTVGVNTIWLQSEAPVGLANGTTSYVTILVTHPDDDDLRKLKVGQVFKRSEKMFREGNDGHKLGLSTGNHLHISVSQSKFVPPYGWAQNKRGAWDVLGKPIKPEQAFYLSRSTKVVNDGGLKFVYAVSVWRL